MKVCLFIVALVGAIAGSGCASAPKTAAVWPVAEKPEAAKALKIIDAHIHTNFNEAPSAPLASRYTLEQYLFEAKNAGVVGAVAHTHDVSEGYEDLRSHGIIHCAGVGEKIDAGLIERGLKKGQFACIKIYLGYVFRYAYDPAYEPIYRLAEKYDVPVVFHTGDTSDSDGLVKYAHPLTVDEVAVKHRKVRFVLAHAGNPWIESAAEVAYKNSNVYIDGSALLIGNLYSQPVEKVDAYLVKPISWIFGYVEDPRKLLFGTDWPLTKIEPYVAAFQRAIPPEHWQAVFHDNAVAVFKDLKKLHPGQQK